MATPGKPRELSREVLRNIYLIRTTFAVVVVLIFWVNYLVAVWFKTDLIDLIRFREQPKNLDTAMFLNVAIGASVLTPLVTWWYVSRALYFARYGVLVDGVIRSTGIIKMAGSLDITYEYEFNGRSYKSKASVPDIKPQPHVRGGPVRLLVDPRNPSKSKLYDDVIVCPKTAASSQPVS